MEDKQITLQIDGHFITVPEGSTILEAATKIGINIPTLCHIDLKGTCIKNNPASCRICVVEVIGRRNLAPACATRCTEGMVVKTSTLRVMNARKVVAELILSDHPNDCLTVPNAATASFRHWRYASTSVKCLSMAVNFLLANGKSPLLLSAIWINVFSAVVAKVSVTTYRQSVHSALFAADLTRR